MKEKPILLNSDMVRAVLNGSKTQTRRVVKSPCRAIEGCDVAGLLDQPNVLSEYCPFGQVGDRLWVRETFGVFDSDHQTPGCKCYYKADTLDGSDGDDIRKAYGYKYTPSIHMPRWASRITLEITGVRVERLQDISRGDCMQEGCPFPNIARETDPKQWFAELWNSIYGTWEQNPWVWVIEFKVVRS